MGRSLARHENFARAVPANYPRQCHASVSTRWNPMALLIHNLSAFIRNVFCVLKIFEKIKQLTKR